MPTPFEKLKKAQTEAAARRAAAPAKTPSKAKAASSQSPFKIVQGALAKNKARRDTTAARTLLGR